MISISAYSSIIPFDLYIVKSSLLPLLSVNPAVLSDHPPLRKLVIRGTMDESLLWPVFKPTRPFSGSWWQSLEPLTIVFLSRAAMWSLLYWTFWVLV